MPRPPQTEEHASIFDRLVRQQLGSVCFPQPHSNNHVACILSHVAACNGVLGLSLAFHGFGTKPSPRPRVQATAFFALGFAE